jgi:hypothetical protein
MRHHLGLAILAMTGCVEGATSSAQHAREVHGKCQSVSPASIEPVLMQSMVDSVEPAYVYANGGPNGRIARLAGAQIHMHPLQGASREWVERALECHEARIALGEAPSGADPYRPAQAWVDIDVQSDRDGYVVRLTSDDVGDAHEILQRAQSFTTRRN